MNLTTVTINGVHALLMHNGQLADPLNDHAKALARLTKKKSKTDADHEEVRECEWRGGLYIDDDGSPCLPGEVIEGCLYEGAKRYKLGKTVKGAVIVDGNWAIEYDGPKDIDKLWKHGGFKKLAGVKIGCKRVIRCRPMFPKWSCKFDVHWDPTMIDDENQLLEIVESAGISGIGDWRPKFGRFKLAE